MIDVGDGVGGMHGSAHRGVAVDVDLTHLIGVGVCVCVGVGGVWEGERRKVLCVVFVGVDQIGNCWCR